MFQANFSRQTRKEIIIEKVANGHIDLPIIANIQKIDFSFK